MDEMAVRVQTRTDEFNERVRKLEQDLATKEADLEVENGIKKLSPFYKNESLKKVCEV